MSGSDVVVETGLTPAQSEMVLANTGLIGFVLKRNRFLVGGVYEEIDAWQDGFFGLVRAVQKFDPGLGYTFATYAPPQIRAAIQRGRGRSEGKQWRTAAAEGTLDQLEAALSLDGLVVDGEIELGDVLPDRHATPDADAVAIEAVDRLRSACRDDLDHAVLDAMLAGAPVGAAGLRVGLSSFKAVRRAERLRTIGARLLLEGASP